MEDAASSATASRHVLRVTHEARDRWRAQADELKTRRDALVAKFAEIFPRAVAEVGVYWRHVLRGRDAIYRPGGPGAHRASTTRATTSSLVA